MPSPVAPPIAILLVEDNPGDARLVELLLREKAPGQFTFSIAETLQAAMLKAGEREFDVALLDLSLPDSHGLETLARLRAFAPMLPIVVLTGTDDDELALQAVQRGAQDYLVKGQGSADPIRRAIRYAIERSLADANLRRSEGQFRAVFENAGLGIGLIDRAGRLFSANPALCAMLGENPAESHDAHLSDYLHPDDKAQVLELAGDLLGGQRDEFSLEARFVPKAGHFAWGRVNLSLVRGPDTQPHFAVSMVEDITARKAMEEQLRLAAKVLEATSEGVFITDAEQRLVHVNPSFTRLTGFEPEDVLGKTPSVLSSGRHGPEFYAALWRSIHEQGYWRGEIWNRKKSGEIYAEWLNISAVKNEAGDVGNYVAVFSDITSRKQSEEKLNHRANHDTLTGLPNRALFLERLEHAMARAQRNQLTIAVLFLDLDHFKQINDSLGHLAGDALLQQVAERLHHAVRNEDTVARMGGDEFTLIVEDVNDFRDAATVAQKILRQFALPFQLNGQPHRVTTSIGISLYPGDGDSVAELLRQADEAMYAAKKQGRGSFRFASADLSEKAFEHQALEAALTRALAEERLEVHYQPIVSLTDGVVIGAEALLRWRHPDIGLMVPGQFLPLAIESGLIQSIGHWVMRTAFTQAVVWRAAGHADVRLCVNVCRAELHHPDFLDGVEALLAETGLPANIIDFELPETLAMEASPLTIHSITALRGLGARVSLDDFGAGRTDFRTLRHTPVDVLKIAPDFIRDVTTNPDEAKLVRAATAAAHSLRMQVVAKAVETTDQFNFLRQHRCDSAQGYFFSRPVPAEELLPFLDKPFSLEV